MMLSVFMTASSARRDDERVVRALAQIPEIGRRAAPDPGNGVDRAALVDAQTAIHPIDLAAVLFRLAHQGGDRVLRDEMVLLLDIAAMHRVGMRLLRRERLQHRALIGEDVDVVAPLGGEIDQPQRRRRAPALIGRVHDRDGDGLLVSHNPLPQCQMTLAPSARASKMTSSGAAEMPEASFVSSMPRSFSEKLSASTRTP